MSIIDILEVQRASLWLLDKSRSTIECQVLLDKHKGALIEVTELREADFPMYFQALKSGEPIVAGDARTDLKTSEFTEVYLIPNDITSMLDIPIFKDKVLIGIICCEHQGPIRQWQNEEINFVFEMAKLLESFN